MGSDLHFAWQQSPGPNVRFGSLADIEALSLDVCFTPKSGHWNSVTECPLCAKSGHSAVRRKTSLFDHLVGAGKQRLRHGETECLRGFAIDYQIVFGRCLYRHVGRFFPLENAVDVPGG